MEQCELLEKSRQKEHQIRGYTLGSSCHFLGSSNGIYPFDVLWNWFRPKLKELAASPEDVKQLRDTILQLAVQGSLTADWRKEHPNVEPASVLVEKIKKEKKRLKEEGKIKKQKPLPEINPEEIPFEVPESWEWVRLGEVINLNYGKGIDKKDRIERGEVPIYGANGVLGYCNKPLINGGCIIIGRKGSAGAVNYIDGACWPSDVTYYIKFNELKAYTSYYCYQLLKSLNLETIAKGIKPGLNKNEVYSIIIPLLPIKEQIEIVNRVDRLMDHCDRMEEELMAKHSLGEKTWASMAASF
jgi:type I restriction enzyme S subunit